MAVLQYVTVNCFLNNSFNYVETNNFKWPMISVRIRATIIISASNCKKCIGLLNVFSVLIEKNDFSDYMQEWYCQYYTIVYWLERSEPEVAVSFSRFPLDGGKRSNNETFLV